jgi:hypothetical protein
MWKHYPDKHCNYNSLIVPEPETAGAFMPGQAVNREIKVTETSQEVQGDVHPDGH